MGDVSGFSWEYKYIYIYIRIYIYICIRIYICIHIYIIIFVLHSLEVYNNKKPYPFPHAIRLFVFPPSICFALFLSGLEGSRFEIPWLAGTHATAYSMSPPAGVKKWSLNSLICLLEDSHAERAL